MESARRAGDGDLPVLGWLLASYGAEMEGRRGGRLLFAQMERAEFARSLGDPSAVVVVGSVDDVVVGFAHARESAGSDERVAALDAMYVEPAARGVGVGEAMLGYVTAWARERSCSGLDAPALPGVREAKAFFEDQGFTARLLVMHRDLGGR